MFRRESEFAASDFPVGAEARRRQQPYRGCVKGRLSVLDPFVGAAITASGLVQLWRDPIGGSFHGPTWPNVVWMCVLGVSVALRRRVPLTSLALLPIVGVPVQLAWYRHASQPPFQPFPAILLVVYAVSVTIGGTRRRAALSVVIGATAITDIAALAAGRHLGDVIPAWVFVTLAWLLGRAVRRHQDLAEAEGARATRLERERDEASRAAAEAERARIARELHDVITHTVSGIVVQASVEARSIDDGETREVLTAIERAGREALVELRRLLGVLRHGDRHQSLAPQPGLSQLDALVGASGLPAVLRREGDDSRVAAGVDLSAYRVVQEALTNVRKHSRDVGNVEVTIRNSAAALEIEVCDDGSPVDGAGPPGFGLIGLRERVALHGGQLQAGRILPKGYRLWVRLPAEVSAPI